MSEIPNQLTRWSNKVDRLWSQWENSKQQVRDARKAVHKAQNKIDAIGEAREIAQAICQNIQQKVHTKIAGVVSKCLSSVFEDPYEFKILFERKRGRTEARLVFERDGKQITDPMGSSGGGCVDVAALPLRLSCLMLKRPAARKTIIMDEPFKSPSAHYRSVVRQLMETLSKEMGFQFIMVTNIEELQTGEVVEL